MNDYNVKYLPTLTFMDANKKIKKLSRNLCTKQERIDKICARVCNIQR